MPTLQAIQKAEWGACIPAGEWEIYRDVIKHVRASGVRFAIGGAFGLAAYTNHLRNTKDLDLYVLPADRDKAVGALSAAGMTDYYDQLSYDRRWIYRGWRDNLIVDIIWAMANQRDQIDEEWLDNARAIDCRGEHLLVIAPEEMLWQKLYVMQRDRCDWPDVLNMLGALGGELDWHRLMRRLGPDRPLLGGALSVFKWVCPDRCASIPAWVWQQTGITPPDAAEGQDCRRLGLLDSRPWFHV